MIKIHGCYYWRSSFNIKLLVILIKNITELLNNEDLYHFIIFDDASISIETLTIEFGSEYICTKMQVIPISGSHFIE